MACSPDLAVKGDLNVQKDGEPVKEAGRLREIIAEAVENQLPIIARNALVVK